MINLDWKEIETLKLDLIERLHSLGAEKIWGVPRGGQIICGLLSGDFDVVNTPEEADAIVDDIVDTGDTMDYYTQEYDLPFQALVGIGQYPDWVVFPWECHEVRETESNEEMINEVGEGVRKHLVEVGVETPMRNQGLSPSAKKTRIEKLFEEMMHTLGLDLEDDSLEGTPKRVAKMFVDEFFYGMDYSKFPKMTTVENKAKYDGMVRVKEINVSSNCEHHFVIIDGTCSIAYIPKDKVLGLSKLNRLVDFFARRPQIQERLTEQIWYALQHILGTDDIAVTIDAVHHCVKSRGIKDTNSSTFTAKLGGSFKNDPATREEFYSSQK